VKAMTIVIKEERICHVAVAKKKKKTPKELIHLYYFGTNGMHNFAFRLS